MVVDVENKSRLKMWKIWTNTGVVERSSKETTNFWLHVEMDIPILATA